MEDPGGAPAGRYSAVSGDVEKASLRSPTGVLGEEQNNGFSLRGGVPDLQVSPPVLPSLPSSGPPSLLGRSTAMDAEEAHRSGDEASFAYASASHRPESPASPVEDDDRDTPCSPPQQTTSPQTSFSPLVSEVAGDALPPAASLRQTPGTLTRGMSSRSSSAGWRASPGPVPSSTPPSPASSRSGSSPGGRVSSPVSSAPLGPAASQPAAPGRPAEASRPRSRGDSHTSGAFDKSGESFHGAGRGGSACLERGAYDREGDPAGSLLAHSPFFSPLQSAGGSASAGATGSNRPQHPLVHASTPSWVKYGEEHYPEEAVPIEYQWIEDDGTCCCYVTDFLLYNKKGERLLQVETLDQDELADVALYGKLVHVALVHPPEALEARKHPTACQVYPHLLQQRRRQNSLRGRKHQATEDESVSQQVSPRAAASVLPKEGDKDKQGREGDSGAWRSEGDSATSYSSQREDGDKKEEKLLGDGEKEVGGSGAATPSLGTGRKVLRKRGGMLHHPCITPKIPRPFRTFPVRVDLTEWMIDYGKSASQTPYVWLVSSLNRYYRLEKPAGRYAPVLQSLKYKFEVASRVIKQLSVNRLYPYQELVDHLTADSRLKQALAKKPAGKGEDESQRRSLTGGSGELDKGEAGADRSDAGAPGPGGEGDRSGDGALSPQRQWTREETAGEADKAGDDAEEDEKEEGDFALGKGAGLQDSPRKSGVAGSENEGLASRDPERLKDGDLSGPSSVAGDEDDDRPAGDLASGLATSPSSKLSGHGAHASAASSLLGSDFGNLILPPGLGSSSSLPLDPSSLFTSSKFISALAIKKNKNCHLLSLSDPDGTGVRTLPDGSLSPESPWGAALAVEGCTEESLIEVFPFLESQVAAFEASTGTTGLLASPFMNALRARVFRWVGKLDDDNAVEEVPPLQQTTTPEIVGGRTDEGGLLSHQSEEVLVSLNAFASSCAADRPSLSGAAFARGGPGDRGQAGSGFLDSPAFGDASGFFGSTGPRGGRRGRTRGRARGDRGEGGRGRGRRYAGRDAAFSRFLGDDREGDFFAGDEEGRGRMDPEKERLLKRDGDTQEEDDEALTNKTCDGGMDDGPGLSEDEEGRKRIKREEDGTDQAGPWPKGDEGQRKEEEEEEDELSTLPEWGIEGDPVDVKDELDLEAEDPLYARVPLPGGSFAPYDFPELLELQDFCRVFLEMLQLPSYPVDTLEAALLQSASWSVAQDFSARAAWPPQLKGQGVQGMKSARKKRNPNIPENPLPFIAASTCLAPAPEAFQFLSPFAAKHEDESASVSRQTTEAIRTGAALRDAAAVALADAAKAEERSSGADSAHLGERDAGEKVGTEHARQVETKREEGSGDPGGEEDAGGREQGVNGHPQRDGDTNREGTGNRPGEHNQTSAPGGDDSVASALASSPASLRPPEGPSVFSAASVNPARLLLSTVSPQVPASVSPSSGPCAVSGSTRLHSSAFPVFLSDALFLRLLQLAFLHISDALSRHNKSASSSTGESVNPAPDARPAQLPCVLTAAGSASAAGLGGPSPAAGASTGLGAPGSAETPAAATWLGSARGGNAGAPQGPFGVGAHKGEGASAFFGRWTEQVDDGEEGSGRGGTLHGGGEGHLALGGSSLWAPSGRDSGGMSLDAKGDRTATKAVVGVAMKHFWRHAALGPRLRRLVPRHAEEDEEERDESQKEADEEHEERESGGKAKKGGLRRKELGGEGETAEGEAEDATTEEESQGRETGRDGKRGPRQISPGAASHKDTNEGDRAPKVLHMLSTAPLDLRMMDFLTWPLVLQRMLFDCLYTPRRVAVKKPRRRPASRSEEEARDTSDKNSGQAAQDEKPLEGAMKECDDEDESLTEAKREEKDEEEAGTPQTPHTQEREKGMDPNDVSVASAEEAEKLVAEAGEESGGKCEPAASCLASSPRECDFQTAKGEDGEKEPVQEEDGDAPASAPAPGDPPRGSGRRDGDSNGEDGEGEEKIAGRIAAEGEQGEREDAADSAKEAKRRQGDAGAETAGGEEAENKEAEMAVRDEAEPREENGVRSDEEDANAEEQGDENGVDSFQDEDATKPPLRATTRSRDTKRKREVDEDDGEGGKEKDASQTGEQDDGASPADGAELKSAGARKKTRRASNDAMLGDDEGESASKAGNGEEDDDEEEAEEEVERLEWHLDDQKAAQCGILPSRAEAMAITFHDMRTHSEADVTRRLQLLQWLIACIANGWMGKFFLDAKVEALFRARANTLRLRMASMGAALTGACRPQAGAGATGGAKVEGADGDSGLAPCSSTEAPAPPLSTNADDSAAVDGERPEDPNLPASSEAGDAGVSSQSLPSSDSAAPVCGESTSPSEPAGPASVRGRRAGDSEEKKSGRASSADGESALPGGKRKRGGASQAGAVGGKGEEEDCASVSEAAGKTPSGNAEAFEAEDDMGRSVADGACTAASAQGPGGENALNPSARGVGRGKKPMGRVSNWEMELLAQKFPIRGEILGEDRYLNRYFLVPTARGVPRVFVEAFEQTRIDPAEALEGFLDHVTSAAVEEEERRKEKEGNASGPTAGLSPGMPHAMGPRGGGFDASLPGTAAPQAPVGGALAGLGEGANPAACAQAGVSGDRGGEVGRRSSRRIALMKEEQRHQQELQDSLSAVSVAVNGAGRPDDRKRKRGSLSSEGKRAGLLGPSGSAGLKPGDLAGALVGPAAVLAKDGSVVSEKAKLHSPRDGEARTKHLNDFVRRAVGFESISTYLHYLDETLKACGLFVVPPGRPLQQLQHALSPYLLRERALKEKLRRVDQQFQQLAAASPLPTPVPTFVPPSPFAAAIWHGCRLFLQIEEALLLPLFSSSWGFASEFQKQQHILRLLDQTRDQCSTSGAASRSRGESKRGAPGNEDDSGSASCGPDDEKESGQQKPESKEKEDQNLAQTDRDLLHQLRSRVWPQDVLHRCLSALAAHANIVGGVQKGQTTGGVVKKLEDAKSEKSIKVEADASKLLATDGEADADAGHPSHVEDQEAKDRAREERQEEEQEAQWMERRICLGVFVQLLLYIENRLHTLSNVHTAAWHLQQHEQWRREVTALGGASLLTHLALPLPPFEFAASASGGDTEKGAGEKAKARDAKKGREARDEEAPVSPSGSRRRSLSEDDGAAETVPWREKKGQDRSGKGEGSGEADGDDEAEERDGEKPNLDWQSRDGDDEDRRGEREEADVPGPDSHEGPESPRSTCSKAEAPALPSPRLSAAAEREPPSPVSVPAASAASALSPTSPLRRIHALIEAIGWERDRVFGFLRDLRTREFDEMKRMQELEGLAPQKALFERELFEGATLQSTAASSSFLPDAQEDPVLSWTEIRNRHDVLAIWGCYLNLWKAHGLDKQKAIDARTTVDRNTFLSLLAHEEQKAHLPEVGSRLFYFRKGHEQMMKAMQEECVDASDRKRWLDSTSIPLSIPFELGRVEELVVDSISYHPGIISPLPRPPAAATSAALSLLSGPAGPEAETACLFPEKMYAFSIVDDPYALGLLVGDAARQRVRNAPSQTGAAKREAPGPSAGAAPTATPGVSAFSGSAAPTTTDLLLSSRLSNSEGPNETDFLAVPASNSAAASTPGRASSTVRSPGLEPNFGAVDRGELDESVTPSDPFLSREKTLPAGVIGKSELELLCAADPIVAAAQEAARGKHLLLQEGKGRDEGDAAEVETKAPVETAPYYRMVCRVLKRTHDTTADNITDRVKSIVAAAAAANEEKPHTRTSSRLMSYQNRSLSSRSGSRSSSSCSERRAGFGRHKGQGGSGDDGAGSQGGAEGAFQSPHASGPQGEREVVLCVPMRADDVEFVVRREKVFHALNLNWIPGMKFRMVFHTTVPASSSDASAGKEKDGTTSGSGKDSAATGWVGAVAGGATNAASAAGGGAGGQGASGAGAGLSEKGSACAAGDRPAFVSTTTRYTGTIRRVDLLHPDFWENVVVEWEDRSRAGLGALAGSGSSRSAGSGTDRGTERGGAQKHDADSGFENVSLWELEPLKRLKRPGGSAGD
ncbi:Chloroquine resistance marker protein, related [Neospora caninum Liverpool]|uniref:Chloroquine resistance marker protein, related n=1 Tax=Neospora caninum (strain Liverpool) TaxID=572307 RepID=F0VLG9_NEOCL|nr:Chloroquine resistance marker protein, related [Neospora caninum Liverpool]CBZ54097.1 Chloroquine resistance marker protein, related [Neospora caninum Liverpool]CEL68796.1 TPA: Chloroquine resistance marker protein, related [Neospora caninum Liverpool]|eukprot:XP_003884128.1 Chloroquine resistance marker protein, related [Neospora caninum Liverpool]